MGVNDDSVLAPPPICMQRKLQCLEYTQRMQQCHAHHEWAVVVLLVEYFESRAAIEVAFEAE